MTKPTVLQSLLGLPSQTYSFPPEKVYYSTKQDMLRVAAETKHQAPSQTTVLRGDERPQGIKPAHDVRAQPSTQKLLITDLDEADDDDSDRDVFYTPNTSPRTSLASTIAAPLRAPSPPVVVSTKTSFTHVNTSTTSISSSALDGHSLFSIASSDTTHMTSTVQSDAETHVMRVKTRPEPPQVTNGHVDQEWSKDVRWLVQPAAKATRTPRRRHPATVETESKSQTRTRTKPNTAIAKNISKTTPSIMSSMIALLEEEEPEDTPYMLDHPRSSVLISTPRRSGPRSRMTSNPAPTSAPSSRVKAAPGTYLPRRRSRSLGHGSSSQASSSSSHNTSTSSSASSSCTSSSHRTSKYASSSSDPFNPNTTSLPTFTPGDLPSHGTPGYTSLVLPRAPVPLSQTSHRPKGLFSLKDTLPAIDVNGKVDLTRSGIAQTTMASVEVVRGLSGAPSSATQNTTPGKKLMGLFRRGSSSHSTASRLPSAFGSSEGRVRSQSEDGIGKGREVQSEASDSPLGFTSYRAPPKSVPGGSVLVQVWAVGVDGVDWRLVFGGSSGNGAGTIRSKAHAASESRTPSGTTRSTPKRSVSLRSTLGRFGGGQHRSEPSSPATARGTQSPSAPPAAPYTPAAGVGYIPGRSFVGRVLECGWEVEEEMFKRGDWVVGLLELKKCGALTEFIVVDRHRVHRAPYPLMPHAGLSPLSHAPHVIEPPTDRASSSTSPSRGSPAPPGSSDPSPLPSPSSSRSNSGGLPGAHVPSLSRNQSTRQGPPVPPPSLEELALLALCGIPAYRAIRTFALAFSDGSPGDRVERNLEYEEPNALYNKARAKEAYDGARRRRALVLRGHDGPGAMAVQMLVRRGWRVCVHVPFACLAYEGAGLAGVGASGSEYRMRRVEERVRAWGGEEVIFDDGEKGEGVDERGPAVRVIERLCEDGDVFDAVLDTVGGKEVWEAAERLLKSVGGVGATGREGGNGNGKKEKPKKVGIGVKQFTTLVGDTPGRIMPSAGDNLKAGLRSLNFGGGKSDGKKVEGKVGYAWVSHAQDVDWEGEDIKETLGSVLRTVMEDGIRPWVGENTPDRVVPFEKAPRVFVSGESSQLTEGGTVVVKVVG
ncbi:hypothetical protein LshimejAT787_0101670 [Lyophyllum shimeji]|uniref:Uncharacterized protein n=1 Tax=Lyophyllum shimeji TaxID=47721 RepID=A0A9P3PCN3_LYOSH|nr:hypothetical protein LshimejAT787_0101670 [Lyophyllum shimeji]